MSDDPEIWERQLIERLHAMPESTLKGRVRAVLEAVVVYAGRPRCVGFRRIPPRCETQPGDCEQCGSLEEVANALDLLDHLERSVPKSRS